MYILKRIAVVVVSASILATSNVSAHSNQRNPLTYLTRVENAVINTPSHRIHSSSNFDLTFDLHNGEQSIKLSLTPNHAVIQEGAVIQYLGEDGETRKQVEFDRSQYLVYKGSSWVNSDDGNGWIHAGWARVILHNDGGNPLFEGAFRLHGNSHHVQTRTNFLKTRQESDPEVEEDGEEFVVVWRDTDVGRLVRQHDESLHKELKRATGVAPTCESDSLGFNHQPDHPLFRARKRDESFLGAMSPKALFGRQSDGQTFGNSAGINLLEHIGSTDGCSSTRKVALVGIATDCTYTASFNSDEDLRKNLIKVVNAASVQFEDAFNITLGLKTVTILPKDCPSSVQQSTPWNQDCKGPNIQERLNLFSAWRGTQADQNAYWSLFSTCGSGAAVGLAWLGQACVQTAQVAQSEKGINETVSGANVIVRTDQEWQVFAHETGHTFGAVHDCDSNACLPQNADYVKSQQCCPLSTNTCDAGGRFIMNPSTGNNITLFSPCTIGNICTAIGRNSVKTGCLTQNKDISTIQGSQCGNGIVEQGEQCDCGGPDGCGANSCCDPTTCQFKQGAQCDPSNEDCCTQSCQFAGSGTVCRSSTGVCDPQEVCNGTAAACPEDVTAPDGQGCGADGLTCASGQCTSRNLQCKTIMGIYTTNNDTFACSDAECRISCQSPQFGPNTCYAMQQNFLDGTPCTGGGKCSNGMCKGGSFGQEVKSWISKNKTLVIALASVLGGIVLLSLCCCVVSRCRRSRQRSKMPPPQYVPPMQIQSQMPLNAAGWTPQDSRRSQRGNLGPYAAGGNGGGGQHQYPAASRQRSERSMGQQSMGVTQPMQSLGGWRNDGRWDPNMVVDHGGNGQGGYGAVGGQGYEQGNGNVMMPLGNTWQPSMRYA